MRIGTCRPGRPAALRVTSCLLFLLFRKLGNSAFQRQPRSERKPERAEEPQQREIPPGRLRLQRADVSRARLRDQFIDKGSADSPTQTIAINGDSIDDRHRLPLAVLAAQDARYRKAFKATIDHRAEVEVILGMILRRRQPFLEETPPTVATVRAVNRFDGIHIGDVQRTKRHDRCRYHAPSHRFRILFEQLRFLFATHVFVEQRQQCHLLFLNVGEHQVAQFLPEPAELIPRR